MTTVSAATLFTVATVDELFSIGIEVAKAFGLPVDSWRAGDPTLSYYRYLAEVLGSQEEAVSEYIKAGFLDDAEGDWLTVRAKEVFNVDRIEATAATSVVTLTNSGASQYDFEAGDLTVRNSATKATYHTTSSGTLVSGGTLPLDVIADEDGTAGSSGLNEIDEIVTTIQPAGSVTISASTVAVGSDEQSDESLRESCRNTTGALSPDGPPDAYEYVCTNPDLTGVTDITRAKSTYDSDTGDVTVYVATASGPASPESVAACLAAVLRWATPLCITPTVVSASPTTVNVLASVSGESIPSGSEAAIESELGAYLSTLDIGGLVARSKIDQITHNTIEEVDSVDIDTPAADIQLDVGFVAVLGNVEITVV